MSEPAMAAVDPYAALAALDRRLRAEGPLAEHDPGVRWSVLAIRVGTRWFLVPREEIDEVLPPPAWIRIPRAPPWLRGLINLRGRLLPVTELRLLFDEPLQGAARDRRLLICRHDRVPAALLVDEVAGLRHFGEDERVTLDAVQAGAWSVVVDGAFHRDGQAWLALSLARLLGSRRFVHGPEPA
jgi:Chemotaxis signal transduction protein